MKKKQPLQKALLYLIISIPLLFLAPLVLNIGFVALKKDGTYIWLIVGGILAVVAILWVVRAIVLLLKSLER